MTARGATAPPTPSLRGAAPMLVDAPFVQLSEREFTEPHAGGLPSTCRRDVLTVREL
jgi:hypothetical protein